MTARSSINGRPVEFNNIIGQWVYSDTGKLVEGSDSSNKCATCGEYAKLVTVPGPRGNIQARKHMVEVDACIATMVQILNDNGVATAASCCGHGHRPGNIALRDGRWLVIAQDDDQFTKIESGFPLDINGMTREERKVADTERFYTPQDGDVSMIWGTSLEGINIGARVNVGPNRRYTVEGFQIVNGTHTMYAVILRPVPEDAVRHHVSADTDDTGRSDITGSVY
jgi:hypothetical protein